MSDSTYDHYGTSGLMPQQPKIKDCMWDSAKDPYMSFRTWLYMCAFGGIVANYHVGPQLERFLDLFLIHDPQAATTQPLFLSDLRLALTDEHTYGIIALWKHAELGASNRRTPLV